MVHPRRQGDPSSDDGLRMTSGAMHRSADIVMLIPRLAGGEASLAAVRCSGGL